METPTEVLLLHEGELADIGRLLDELGIAWEQGDAEHPGATLPALLIGTPLQMLRWSDDRKDAARIAVCDGGGRTLERKLEVEGVDYILRRPIHPAALRLLILHLVYRGPERRRLRRVNAALPVKFRLGLWARKGLLLEFSVGGCQLLSDAPLESGKKLRLTLPAEIGMGRKLKVAGRVVRSDAAPAGSNGDHVVAVDFGDLKPDVRQRLAAGVVARARQEPARPVPSVPPPTPPRAEVESDLAPRERRLLPRGHYTKPVHGRVGNAAIVLMGTDLSPAGMHVDCGSDLGVGAHLKLDLYGHGDIPPLRLDAVVARDDGERGLYLSFQNLWPGAPALLERLIKTLPVAARDDGDLVITEVVERS